MHKKHSLRALNIKITNFSQLFRRFGILNCNLSDSLKNLPTLFQKWFGLFLSEQKLTGVLKNEHVKPYGQS
jgi:hypothetical protein